jgi:hypothetical protein
MERKRRMKMRKRKFREALKTFVITGERGRERKREGERGREREREGERWRERGREREGERDIFCI